MSKNMNNAEKLALVIAMLNEGKTDKEILAVDGIGKGSLDKGKVEFAKQGTTKQNEEAPAPGTDTTDEEQGNAPTGEEATEIAKKFEYPVTAPDSVMSSKIISGRVKNLLEQLELIEVGDIAKIDDIVTSTTNYETINNYLNGGALLKTGKVGNDLVEFAKERWDIAKSTVYLNIGIYKTIKEHFEILDKVSARNLNYLIRIANYDAKQFNKGVAPGKSEDRKEAVDYIVEVVDDFLKDKNLQRMYDDRPGHPLSTEAKAKKEKEKAEAKAKKEAEEKAKAEAIEQGEDKVQAESGSIHAKLLEIQASITLLDKELQTATVTGEEKLTLISMLKAFHDLATKLELDIANVSTKNVDNSTSK